MTPPEIPVLLRGAKAIAEYLGVTAKHITHLHRQRRIPTINVGGCPCATTGALDEWRLMQAANGYGAGNAAS
ncbi:hypothetical protein M9978_09460 [Sphingomonas sp. MG17]|uniref:Uncharacterized protein n=2 Tax=Sphingomonas tagetis TaxID=2949092 RepID=A0A9X2HMX5_9SPHN|nr:hypothetical protein [Sphingomonas tagetis]